MQRRRFLTAAIGVGASLALARTGVQAWAHSKFSLAERTSRALGSEVRIVAYHRDRAAAERGVAAAFAELEVVEEVMSLYRPHSQLCRLNQEGVLAAPHPYLVEVLTAGQKMSQQSGGAFDVTVQPLWSLYARAAKTEMSPSADEISAACALVDWRRVHMAPKAIRLERGATITLNGIAQGFAADRALAALRSYGVEHALINTGELHSLGQHPEHGDWQVGIQHPRESHAFAALTRLEGRALATSGDYATKFNGNPGQNHVFDPKTGQSPTAFSSVSVVAPSALLADALSTALFVLDLDGGQTLVESQEGVDALFILKDGRMRSTRGFPRVA